ncbi:MULTISPECIES: hypothetical protein [Hyphomicrobiales]|uniref:hypothetical protein n=1 Tax=Hyphomicrobiales TaxID=356 RepID=UPI000375E7E2|nr:MULTISPECIES: hypothetical protein [Phyllobacteriaceae]MCX8567826.1 hypothetical protein [Aminobacter sp. MET-1]
MISEDERKSMLRAHSIGPTMIRYLEEIGIERLAELRGADPQEIAMRMNIALGRRHINSMGVAALRNLIELADSEAG